jgi:hypothetical protein
MNGRLTGSRGSQVREFTEEGESMPRFEVAAAYIRPKLLAGAWGIFCGGSYYSFFAQLCATAASDISGFPNSAVVVIKGVIFAIAIVAFVRSITASTENG